MSVKFVIDSASDVLPEEAKALGVTHLPMRVVFGEESFADSVEISHREFYEKLAASKTLPTTCQIPPADFADCYERLVTAEDEVVVITISSKLSGTYQSAVMAAEEYPGKVFVVDSLSAAVGERILLQRGLELAAKGLSATEIAGVLTEEREKIQVMAIVDTLEYLKKGGRVSATVAFAGGLLSIKPAIRICDGEVAMAGTARGYKQSNALLRKLVLESGGVDMSRPMALVWSGLEDDLLRKFVGESPELWQGREDLPLCSLGCTIGTHVGPGAYGLAFFRK